VMDCTTCFVRAGRHLVEAKLVPRGDEYLCDACFNGYQQTCTRMGGEMDCDCPADRCALFDYTPEKDDWFEPCPCEWCLG
jgi:hypothetical protein